MLARCVVHVGAGVSVVPSVGNVSGLRKDHLIAVMAGSERWYFNKELFSNTPSRKSGIDADKELSYRQQAANFIQDMGQRLQV